MTACSADNAISLFLVQDYTVYVFYVTEHMKWLLRTVVNYSHYVTVIMIRSIDVPLLDLFMSDVLKSSCKFVTQSLVHITKRINSQRIKSCRCKTFKEIPVVSESTYCMVSFKTLQLVPTSFWDKTCWDSRVSVQQFICERS